MATSGPTPSAGMPAVNRRKAPSVPPAERPPVPVDRTLREIESTAVQAALDACEGNITAAARMLGVSRTKLYRDMKRTR